VYVLLLLIVAVLKLRLQQQTSLWPCQVTGSFGYGWHSFNNQTILPIFGKRLIKYLKLN